MCKKYLTKYFILIINIQIVIFYTFFLNGCTQKKQFLLTCFYEYEIYDFQGQPFYSYLSSVLIKDDKLSLINTGQRRKIINETGNTLFVEKYIDETIIFNNQKKYIVTNNTYYENHTPEHDNITSEIACGQIEIFFLNMITHDDIQEDPKKYLINIQELFYSIPMRIECKNIGAPIKLNNIECLKYEIYVDDVKHIEYWISTKEDLQLNLEINSSMETLFSLSGNRLLELLNKYKSLSSSKFPEGIIVKIILLNDEGVIIEKHELLNFNHSDIPDNLFQLTDGLQLIDPPLLKDFEQLRKIAAMSSRDKRSMKINHMMIDKRKSSFIDNIIRQETSPAPYYQIKD